MRTFQAFAVRGKSSPVVTLQAGVDFGGYYWTTTSRRAAKVAALRRDARASVLSRTDDSWRLRAGRALVIDVSRPPEGLRELPVFALAGSALALIAVRYPEQLLGYVVDAAATPKAWRLHQRVLIALRHEDEIEWTDSGLITHRTDRFRHDHELHRAAPRPRKRRSVAGHGCAASLLDLDGTCWLGVDTDSGPIALPAAWRAENFTASVQVGVLAAVNPHLPARACVTMDDSDSPRPSDKSGIVARGNASVTGITSDIATIRVEVDSTTTWNGFRSTPAAA